MVSRLDHDDDDYDAEGGNGAYILHALLPLATLS
jgi:hypothetical protein